MDTKRKKHIFNVIGGCIIVLWLVMIGLQIKKENFNNISDHPEFTAKTNQNIKHSQRDWMGIYLKGKKVGYSVNQISPSGQDYLIQDEIFLRMNLMGQANGIHTLTRSVVDHQYHLKEFQFRMTSGIVTFQASGTVQGNRMFLQTGEGPHRRTNTINLTHPPVIGSSIDQFFRGRELKIGQSFNFPVFDPSIMAQKDMVIRVVSREKLVLNRIGYHTFRLEGDMCDQPMTFWLDQKGTVLKEEGFMGLTLIKSSAAAAPRDIDLSGGEDFYGLAAINIKKSLPNAFRLAYLRLRVGGLSNLHFDRGILNEGRQRFQRRLKGDIRNGAYDGTIEIVQEKTPLKAAYRLPYPDPSGEMSPFLRPEFNIESDSMPVIEKAHAMAGNVKDPVIVAGRLMSWVYRTVEKRPVISVPSALEVLKTRVGDCNEHAVLLTALLRASGIPSRLCAGLVYARGKFFYHAWTEAYLGEKSADSPVDAGTGWISMDATLNQMPVDATHIKLVQGGLESQIDIIGLIGKLRLEVLDYRYD